MPQESETSEPDGDAYILPRYLRYARTLALVSGAAVGIAAGVAVVSTAGCMNVCSGTPCPGQSYIPPVHREDASSDVRIDTAQSTEIIDGGSDTGGGPRPAPLFPRSWLA